MTCDHLVQDGLWARELGLRDDHVETCGDCRGELDHYRFVLDMPGLVAASPSPPGWERRVWAAVARLERPGWRRWLADRRWSWLPAVAAVAAIALYLAQRSELARAPAGPGLELAVRAPEPLGLPSRSLSAVVGDLVDARGRGAAAIWAYDGIGTLVARCPGGPDCASTTEGLALTFRVNAPGRHRVLAIAGVAGLEPEGDFDRDVLMARGRGAHLELRSVLARAR